MANPSGQSPPVPARQLRMLPCTITNLSPLQALLPDGSTVTGMRVIGATYTLGAAAVALWSPPAPPIIMLIGA